MAKDKKFLQDEWKSVSSEVSEEERWVLISLTDTQNVEKNFERKTTLVEELLVKLQQDENTLVDIHQKLTRLIADWTGDFQKEVRFAQGPNIATKIYEFLQKFQDIEKNVNTDFENSKRLCKDIRVKYENMTVKTINEKTHAEIVEEIKLLVNAFSQWMDYDKKLSLVVTECNSYIIAYNAQSSELGNYKNMDEKFNDLLEGKGVYSAYSVDQRKAILARYVRSNEYAIKKRQDMITKVNTFMKEGGMTTNLVIEEKKTKNYMYFNDSLARLREAGFKRHLRPVEYFAIFADVETHGSASPYYELRKNLWSNYGEWLSMAVMIKDGMLHIAMDPENIAWNDKKSEHIYTGPTTITIPAPQLKADKWNENISEFTNYFGVGCKGIYLPKEGVWGPVGFGGNVGNGRLVLVADYSRGTSCGVR